MRLSSPVLTRALSLILVDPQKTWKIVAPGVGLLAMAHVADVILALTLPGGSAIALTGTAFVALLTLSALVSIVVNWHRYALLDGSEATQDRLAYLRYFLTAFVLGVLLFLVVFVAWFAGRLPFMLMGARGTLLGLVDVALHLSGVFLFLWLSLRLCLVLPAAALGQRVSLRASWQATAPLSAELLRITLLLATINIVCTAVTTGLWQLPDTLSLIISFPVDCALIVLSASVISALYGALVQGRAL